MPRGRQELEAGKGEEVASLCVLKAQNSLPAPPPILPLPCNTFKPPLLHVGDDVETGAPNVLLPNN